MTALSDAILAQYPIGPVRPPEPGELLVVVHGHAHRAADPHRTTQVRGGDPIRKTVRTRDLPATVERWLTLERTIERITQF